MNSAIIITCNAEFFIGVQLKHIYDVFDLIVIVDGPSMPSKETRGDGRRLTGNHPFSTDKTLEIIRSFPDPKKKIKLISRPSPWISKTHKFNEALKVISPGWIWQIDADEFYHQFDYARILQFLAGTKKYTDVEFYAYHFWPEPDYHCVVSDKEWGNLIPWRRVFKYTGQEQWERHEPPRMIRRSPNFLLPRESTKRMGIMMYHYGYCSWIQFSQREIYYGLSPGTLTSELENLNLETNHPHKLVPFSGKHPIDTSFIYEYEPGNLHGNMRRTAVKKCGIPDPA